MATEAEIQAKRDSVDAKRQEVRKLRAERQAETSASSRAARLKALDSEEKSLEQELSSLRKGPKKEQPAQAAAPSKPATAADNKE